MQPNSIVRLFAASLICMIAVAVNVRCEDAANPLDRELVAHWPLTGDARDRTGAGHDALERGGVDMTISGPTDRPKSAAAFNGRDCYLEVPGGTQLNPGKADFSISAWILVPENLDDVPGDILCQYDPATHRGFQLTLKTNAGVASSQSNYRHLQFSIDNDQQSNAWTDCGRPGSALLAFGLVAHDGHLYAGTCEPGEKERGRVYRFESPDRWIDCGSPTTANAVTALAAHRGKLYAGTGKYRVAGSALEESKNTNLGGKVLVYDGADRWTDCGQLPGVEAIGGLVVYRDQLYASSLYRPAGFFRYEGGTRWTECPTPGKRAEVLGVYNGHLYATSYDGGVVFRFDGKTWTDCGQLGPAEDNTQTYSFAVYGGQLYVGTWRTGRVYRFDGVNQWTDVGRLGNELEVMGMLVHNGRLIAGTLPLAEVYEFDGRTAWRRLAQLDHTPEVRYRRAWTMAEFGGRVYCSTLPSGRVYSYEVGKTASWDQEFPAGWHHVAALKRAGGLHLYVDGRQVAESPSLDANQYDLASTAPLRIGLGTNDYFCGRLSDVRWYRRAIEPADIANLVGRK